MAGPEPQTASEAKQALAAVVRDSGLVEPGPAGVVLVSGGPDSACAAAGLVAFRGAERLSALHLDYGLRGADSERDAQTCRRLCDQLGIDLQVERPDLPQGNLQAAARQARYAAAERLAELTGAAWIATGHTRTDLAETFLYRLATSPGRRPLLGLPARRGRIVRPLLAIDRDQARHLATAARLPFADDASNLDPRYARNRIRGEVLPVLRELSPEVEANVAETQAELAEEVEVLDRVVAEFLARTAAAGLTPAILADALAPLDPGLRRLVLRGLAERAAGEPVPLNRGRAQAIWRLANTPEGGEIDLGNGLRAICEAGIVRFALGPDAVPAPTRLPVPGECRFGLWRLRAKLHQGPLTPSGPQHATLDAAALGPELTVRAWREGDRIHPLGLEGTQSLQDLFTNAKVPRSLRRTLPVVAAGDRIAWVAGVVVSEDFKVGEGTEEVAILTARQA